MHQEIDNYEQQQSNSKGDNVHYDYQEDEENLTPQPKAYQNNYQEKPQIELQNIIMQKINNLEKEQDLISKDLKIKLEKLLQQIIFSNAHTEQILKMRMNELALSKILVNTHSKTQFYLVKAHHHLGEAYLNYKCYEQALDHLTISLKRNAKINDMKEITLYHSYLLTTYSRCYFQISSYEDALEILKKAYDIQLNCQTQSIVLNNIQTLRLMSNCYLKLKKYAQSLEFIEKFLSSLQSKKGKDSKQYAKAKIQKSKILICTEQSHQEAISIIQQAIQTLCEINYDNLIQVADYYETLAGFYQKINQPEKQIQNLYKKFQIYKEKYQQGHEKTLKVKKNIAFLLQKYNKTEQSIKQLHQILQYEEKLYPQNKAQIGKTLKALGLSYVSLNKNLNQAEQYLKKAQKMLSEHGAGKSIKEIKMKLQELKEKKNNKLHFNDQFKPQMQANKMIKTPD